jgi:hypothetical protein
MVGTPMSEKPYPCSVPGCKNRAGWAILSEQPREADPEDWGSWNYMGTMACDGHREAAEAEALATGKHYQLIAVSPVA